MLRTTSDTEKWVISRFNCSQTWTNFLELNLNFFFCTKQNWKIFNQSHSTILTMYRMPISLIHALSSKADKQQYQKGACKKKKKNDSITFQNACHLKNCNRKKFAVAWQGTSNIHVLHKINKWTSICNCNDD